MSRAWFDLAGIKLEVLADDDTLLNPLLRYLSELKTDVYSPPNFVLSVTHSNDLPAAPSGAEVIFDGPLPEGPRGRLLSEDSGARWFVVPDDIVLRIAPDSANAHMFVRPSREALVGGALGIHLIETALRQAQQYLLHGAALRLRGTDDAFLLFAPSGAGKTTTALALALDGFGLLTDDASVVAPPGPGASFRVWGLPRALKVHQKTAAMLPRLSALLGDKWNMDGEQVLTWQKLRTLADVGTRRPCPLTAMVALGTRVPGAHEVHPIKRSDALMHLAADNVFKAPGGVRSEDLQRFEAISRIVTDVPTYELRVGADLSTLGTTVLSGLM